MASGNLNHPLTRFIGRDRELVELGHLLAASRLITLTGAGGCGKTRLALAVAGLLRERFAENMQYGFLAHLRMDVAVAHPESFCKLIGIIP